ncbi:MAG: hypothetical protein ACFFC3_15320, partial [Candidatus Odinarchaeota archaeon]
MREFKINDYLTIRLENNTTYVYVKNKRFIQCRRLVLNFYKDDIEYFNGIQSIDELPNTYEKYLIDRYIYKNGIHGELEVDEDLDFKEDIISPEDEFWGHCSNLQTWYEHEYNTRLLKSDLAFPLLKELIRVGDTLAKKVFKEEVVNRLTSGNLNVIFFLLSQGYLDYFTKEEKELVLNNFEEHIEKLINISSKDDRKLKNIEFWLIKWFLEEKKSPISEKLYLNKLINIAKGSNKVEFERLLMEPLEDHFRHNKDDLNKILYNTSIHFLNYLIHLFVKYNRIIVKGKYGEELCLNAYAEAYFKSIQTLLPSLLNSWLINILPKLNEKTIRYMFRFNFFNKLTYEDLKSYLNEPSFKLLNYFVIFNKEVFFIDEYSITGQDYTKSNIAKTWIYNRKLENPRLWLRGKSIKNIKDIYGLDKLTDLEILNLSDNEISVFDGLENL